MVDLYQGKTSAEWAALGKHGKSRAASRGGQTGKEWAGDGADPYDRSAIQTRIEGDSGLSRTAQETKQFQDWTQGASGFSDIYRKGKPGEVTGPEYGIPDVDIHGYPTGWKQEGGTKDGEEGQWITTADNKRYFKPRDTGGGGGGNGDQPSTGGSAVVTGAQPFALSTLTSDMDLSNAIAGLLDMNSPLFKAAGNAAMQRMAKRGLGIVNSSIAFGEVERAILEVAMPIAKAEVDNLIANMNKNTEWTNAERKQANDYVFGKMLKDIDNAAAHKLGLMKEEFGLAKAKVAGTASIMGEGGDIPLGDRPGYWKEYMDMISGITGTS